VVATLAVSGILVFIGVAVIGGYRARQRIRAEFIPSGRWANLGGRQVHYQVLGEGGPTIVLEAGQNNSSITWCLVAPELAKHARVFLYDRPGLGWSEPSESPRTAAVITEELHRLLLQEGIPGPYILVGHSMGGLYAKVFAAHHPDEVKAVVFVDAANEQQRRRWSAAQEAATVRLIANLQRQFRIYAWLASTGIMALAPEKIPVDPRLTPAAAAEYRAQLAKGPEVFDTMIRELEAQATSFTEVQAMAIKKLEAPVVVLRRGRPFPMGAPEDLPPGTVEETERTWRQLQEDTAMLSASGRVVEAQNSGHDIQLDEPQLVVNAILSVFPSTSP